MTSRHPATVLGILTLCAAAVTVASCATTGRAFDQSRAAELTPGVSTVQDAITLFGEPSSETTYPDGSRLLQWIYVRGTLVGGSGAHLAILFDDHNVMVRITHRFKQ